eukprot:TRINITY_DN9447_c0_g1_i2.p1 TRINITY_DN9447_c0_g1~~TRINITY_DN9447_c0_g1_i2.p1  ORF type:complete len:519 (-),score=62.89 TRINITY_DN9447_c0_g1_i2:75-1517(-)
MGEGGEVIEQVRYVFSSVIRTRMLISIFGFLCVLYNLAIPYRTASRRAPMPVHKGVTVSARACAALYLGSAGLFYFNWFHFPGEHFNLRCLWHTSQFFATVVVFQLALTHANSKFTALMICMQLIILPICGATNRMPLPYQPVIMPVAVHHIVVVFSAFCSIVALRGDNEMTLVMKQERTQPDAAPFISVPRDEGIGAGASEAVDKKSKFTFSFEAVVFLCCVLSILYLLVMFGDAWLAFYVSRQWEMPAILKTYKVLHDAQISSVLYHLVWSYLPYAYAILFLLYTQKPVDNACLQYVNLGLCILGAWHFVILEAGVLSCRAAGDIADCYHRTEYVITLHWIESICFAMSLTLFFLHRCFSMSAAAPLTGSALVCETALTVAALIGFGIMVAETVLVWDKKFSIPLPNDPFANQVHLWPFPGYHIITHFLVVMPIVAVFAVVDIRSGRRIFVHLVEEEYREVEDPELEKQLPIAASING